MNAAHRTESPQKILPENGYVFHILDESAYTKPDFIEKWRALAERSDPPNPFWDPDFLLALESESTKSQLAILSDNNRTLLALAPFQAKRIARVGPWVNRLASNDYAPLAAPLVSPGDPMALSALFKTLVETTDRPVLAMNFQGNDTLTECVDTSDAWQFTFLKTHERAAIQTSDEGEHYRRRTLSKQRRTGLERRWRKLAKAVEHEGPLAIHVFTHADRINAELEIFLELEKRGWKGRAKTALLSKQADSNFTRHAITKLARRKNVAIATLSAGDVTLASMVLLVQNKRYCAWKTTFDEDFATYSPGTQLLAGLCTHLPRNDGALRLDSCTSPNNKIANAIMGERLFTHTMLVFHQEMQMQANAIVHILGLSAQLKESAKKLLKR